MDGFKVMAKLTHHQQTQCRGSLPSVLKAPACLLLGHNPCIFCVATQAHQYCYLLPGGGRDTLDNQTRAIHLL